MKTAVSLAAPRREYLESCRTADAVRAARPLSRPTHHARAAAHPREAGRRGSGADRARRRGSRASTREKIRFGISTWQPRRRHVRATPWLQWGSCVGPNRLASRSADDPQSGCVDVLWIPPPRPQVTPERQAELHEAWNLIAEQKKGGLRKKEVYKVLRALGMAPTEYRGRA